MSGATATVTITVTPTVKGTLAAVAAGNNHPGGPRRQRHGQGLLPNLGLGLAQGSWARSYAPAMPRRQGQRRSTARRPDAQPEDDQADDSAILDQAWAVQAKRARRRQRGRGVLEIVLDFLAGVIGSWP
jgi:hypothetical protein